MADVVANTDTGKVGGLPTAHGFAFYGIPYAQPPFGPRRFQPPVAPQPWDGVRACIAPAPTAPQPATGFTLIPEPTIDGGDAPGCLALNVFTPDLGASGLPVLVWIHGGGFVTGTPSSTWYDGTRFNRDGVVVVSVGYRLGAEGFLPIPGTATNRAVRDWIAALEWVQRNIASFGGDPAKVTVSGQSAGGAATALLLTLPRAKGLLRAAIPMSGSLFPPPAPDAGQQLVDRIAAHLGIDATAAGFARVSPTDLVAAQIAATTPADGAGAAARMGRGMDFAPAVDGDLVPVSPHAAITAGAGADLAVMIGATREEFNAMSKVAPVPAELDEGIFERLGVNAAGRQAYRDGGGGIGQAITDAMFRIPAVRVAEARDGRAPTFHYDFQWATPALGGLGAVHCLDLPFVWDVLDDDHVKVVHGDDPPQELADTMHAAWVRFITDLDPGWAPYDAPGHPTMVFDETCKVVHGLLQPVRSFWP